MLLYAAWAYGMAAGDVVPRYVIFAFIQTHVANKPEEHLQRAIEKKESLQWKPNWKSHDVIGQWVLTERGYKRLVKRFGAPTTRRERRIRVLYERLFNGHKFSVIVDAKEYKTKLEPAIDGKVTSGVAACEKLRELNAEFTFRKSKDSSTTLLNWIIQDRKSFTWKLLTR
jgi:hypothetical protein